MKADVAIGVSSENTRICGKRETTNWSYSTTAGKQKRFPAASLVSYKKMEKVKHSATRGSDNSGTGLPGQKLRKPIIATQ